MNPMNTIGWEVAAAIRGLADLDDGVRLAQLQQDFAAACRGTPRDNAQWHPAKKLLHVQAVSRALAVLFDLPFVECEAAVHSVLLPHPRRQTALDLIDEYRGSSAAIEKLNRERLERSVP